jgi:hypothetical protein
MHDHDFYLYDYSSKKDTKILPLIRVLSRGTEIENRGGLAEFTILKQRVIERLAQHTNFFLKIGFLEYCAPDHIRKKGMFKTCWESFKGRVNARTKTEYASGCKYTAFHLKASAGTARPPESRKIMSGPRFTTKPVFLVGGMPFYFLSGYL